jgi:hypothetical protein
LALFILGAILGSILGARTLVQALVRTRDLYRVDTAGSQMESDLEYETQESRLAFLYALGVSDPNEQLPYVAQARRASDEIDKTTNELRGLGARDLTEAVEEFGRAWRQYDVARDEIIAQILLGNSAEALRVEAARGQPAFGAALTRLHALKAVLRNRARNDSYAVNATLERSVAGLAAFALSILIIVSLLIQANRARRHALESLHNAHVALGEAREMERERAAILQMVSMHTALSRTLATVAGLATRHDSRVGAAIWTESAGELRLHVTSNLPPELVAALEVNRPRARNRKVRSSSSSPRGSLPS